MDKIYEELDRTHTTPGEQSLYYILRTPIFENDGLLKRKAIIELFQGNKEIREELQLKLFNLGRDQKNSATEIIWDEIPPKKNMRLLFNLLALLPVISILIMPFNLSLGITLLFILFGINLYIHYTKGKDISSYVDGINYLAGVINIAKQVSNIKAQELEEYKEILKENAEVCSKIAKNTSSIGHIEGVDMFADYVYILTLAKERQYYNAIDRINSYRKELKALLMKLGELDALLSVASYREGIKNYTEPCLDNEKAHLNVDGVRHPLIKEPVPNSISINESGIVLTGSNMSGKSTFLRTIGVNALLAQTIYTCNADSYCGSFFKLISSISPSDNLLVGKSYYLGEAEALLRIIKSCDKEIPSLCIIDEIFRGTNPIERISASAEILNYLLNNNALAIVATHDLELTEMVDNYGCYYFTEDVDDEGLKFDYKIKKGVSPTRNAIKLLKYLGYPSDIIDRTNKRVDKITRDNIK
jgi:DNA mismatch repair ATPase MutS